MESRRTEDADAAEVMRIASEQIGLAIAQSQPAVEQLGNALQKLAESLARAPEHAGNLPERQALRAELARAITCLQFHDRLTQHLEHVRHHLLDSAALPDRLPGEAPAEVALQRRLSSLHGGAVGGDVELF